MDLILSFVLGVFITVVVMGIKNGININVRNGYEDIPVKYNETPKDMHPPEVQQFLHENYGNLSMWRKGEK